MPEEEVCFDNNEASVCILQDVRKTNGVLVEEVYSKERGRRVEFFGIQLDEMWTFVQNKKNK